MTGKMSTFLNRAGEKREHSEVEIGKIIFSGYFKFETTVQCPYVTAATTSCVA
jgi:hypothetical protein